AGIRGAEGRGSPNASSPTNGYPNVRERGNCPDWKLTVSSPFSQTMVDNLSCCVAQHSGSCRSEDPLIPERLNFQFGCARGSCLRRLFLQALTELRMYDKLNAGVTLGK